MLENIHNNHYHYSKYCNKSVDGQHPATLIQAHFAPNQLLLWCVEPISLSARNDAAANTAESSANPYTPSAYRWNKFCMWHAHYRNLYLSPTLQDCWKNFARSSICNTFKSEEKMYVLKTRYKTFLNLLWWINQSLRQWILETYHTNGCVLYVRRTISVPGVCEGEKLATSNWEETCSPSPLFLSLSLHPGGKIAGATESKAEKMSIFWGASWAMKKRLSAPCKLRNRARPAL